MNLLCSYQEPGNEENDLQDYHVVLLHHGNGSWIYDLDSLLPFPCNFLSYFNETIKDDNHLREEFHRYGGMRHMTFFTIVFILYQLIRLYLVMLSKFYHLLIFCSFVPLKPF